MSNPARFQLEVSDPSVTGLVVVSCLDAQTDFVVRTVLPNHTFEYVASTLAFAGARISRSNDSFVDIFREVNALAGKAQTRLANIFRKYGHASVAEMAMLFVFLENIPDVYAAKLFYESSFGAGQQRSTRYQNFGNLATQPLRKYWANPNLILAEEFLEYQTYSDSLYQKWHARLYPALARYFQIDESNKAQISALQARTFDTVRSFLLGGITNRTSLAYLTQAREWAKIIAIFKSENDPCLVALGEQVEFLLAPLEGTAEEVGYTPEAPDLLRYTQRDETTRTAQGKLKEWYEKYRFKITESGCFRPLAQTVELVDLRFGSEKLFAQALLCVNPNLDYQATLAYLSGLSSREKRELSPLLLGEYDCYRQLPEWLGTNSHTYVLNCSYGEYRDFNRHRVWSKFVPLLSSQDKYYTLFYGIITPLYLQVKKLKKHQAEFVTDCVDLQEKAQDLAGKLRHENEALDYLAPQLSIFAANCQPILSGSPKHVSYMADRRQKPGGHINYRALAYQLAEITADFDPFLEAVRSTDPAPDPNSRDQFLDRS